MKKLVVVLNVFLLSFFITGMAKESNQNKESVIKGKKIFESNCIVCHKKNSEKQVEKTAIPLLQSSSKYNFSWLVNWLSNPESYMEKSRMPSFHLKKSDSLAIASFLMAYSSDEYGQKKNIIPNPKLANEGKALYSSKGCNNCHSIVINDELGGPDIKKIGSKTNPKWLFNWIKDPKTYFYKTTMTHVEFSEHEVLALTSWLSQLKWKNMPISKFKQNDKKLIEQGKELTKFYRCSTCHAIAGLDEELNISATPVFNTKDKKALLNFIQNGITGTAMPSWKYTFSKNEINNLVEYIKSTQ